jgi:hypothetical protein
VDPPHPKRYVFFLIERTRLDALRALLPEPMRRSLRVVDQSSNELYLVDADT